MHSVARLRVQSIINSSLWMTGVTGPPGIVGVIFTDPPIQYFIIGYILIGPLLSVFGFVYFSFKDPDKLRSEKYELRKMELGLVEEKGGDIPLDITSVKSIADMARRPKIEKDDDQ